MRRPPGVAMVLPGVGAWLDRDEAVAALGIGQATPSPGEVRVQRCRVLVVLVEVTSGRVGLPDLDDRVAHRPPVAVQHPTGDDDPLSDGLAGMLPGKVMGEIGEAPRKYRRREVVTAFG